MPAILSVAAHMVTGARVAAAPLLAWAIARGFDGYAALVLAFAAATDFADGRVARRFGTASEAGRWFDHFADIAVLLCGYVALSASGAGPFWVPLAIAIAFAYYVVDSLRRGDGRSLIGSRIGHLSGVLNYLILFAVVLDAAYEGRLIPEGGVRMAYLAVPFYSGAAVLSRYFSTSSTIGSRT